MCGCVDDDRRGHVVDDQARVCRLAIDRLSNVIVVFWTGCRVRWVLDGGGRCDAPSRMTAPAPEMVVVPPNWKSPASLYRQTRPGRVAHLQVVKFT